MAKTIQFFCGKYFEIIALHMFSNEYGLYTAMIVGL